MKSTELRELNLQELQERLIAEEMKYDKMAFNHHVTPLDRPSTLTDQRRLVARIKTIIREKSTNK